VAALYLEKATRLTSSHLGGLNSHGVLGFLDTAPETKKTANTVAAFSL
jgi:hypothetical protein